MIRYLEYIFWPNPPLVAYDNPKVVALVCVGVALILAGFILRRWRSRLQNAVTKKLSRSWSGACFWFGGIGLFLVICRAEGISYLSMRLWWGLLAVALIVYIFFQWKLFRSRHYEVLPNQSVDDPRDKYLPKSKSR